MQVTEIGLLRRDLRFEVLMEADTGIGTAAAARP
jgi:hypothetical protein